MIITDIKIRILEATTRTAGLIYDNRAVRRVAPTDIHIGYQKKKGHISVTHVPQGDGSYRITHSFLEIETDEGITGVVGPISNPLPPYYIHFYLKPILIGQDAWDVERLFDIMYRSCINGRKGENMQAISYVDCALWDIRAKKLGLPLYRLLGGPVQERVRAYANTAGYPQDPDSVAAAARELTGMGYTAIKWGVSYGPAHGDEGMRKTLNTFRILREAAGADTLLLLDAWSSWDVPYTLRIAERLKEYDVAFIEEPVMPDLTDSYRTLNARCPIPLSGGEHEYTRWGFKTLLDANACELYQPDPAWSGGISEVQRILALISAYDKRASIHNSLPALGAHMSSAMPSSVIPFAEYLMLVGEASQYFLKSPCRPQNGFFTPPEVPGIGLDIDETKADSSRYMSFSD